ncbi:hypothetical protein B0H21DRAFT_834570 [Amylocystis lapponica]|nr:hypothetical protein B0H21DRAFT_834570 [Amylocystis lapponica]
MSYKEFSIDRAIQEVPYLHFVAVHPHQLQNLPNKAILDCEARIECAETACDEADVRLRVVQESWVDRHRDLSIQELRAADIRSHFRVLRLVADAGDQLVPFDIPPAPCPFFALPGYGSRHLPLSMLTSSHRSGVHMSALPLPPPPVPNASGRVRGRSGSPDVNGYPGGLTGPGGPPPSMKKRSDRDVTPSKAASWIQKPSCASLYHARVSQTHPLLSLFHPAASCRARPSSFLPMSHRWRREPPLWRATSELPSTLQTTQYPVFNAPLLPLDARDSPSKPPSRSLSATHVSSPLNPNAAHSLSYLRPHVAKRLSATFNRVASEKAQALAFLNSLLQPGMRGSMAL